MNFKIQITINEFIQEFNAVYLIDERSSMFDPPTLNNFPMKKGNYIYFIMLCFESIIIVPRIYKSKIIFY